MKRFLFALLMVGVMLTGCGSDNKEEMEKAADSMRSVSINDVYDTISALSAEKMVMIDDNLIENYYGINTEDLSEYVFAQAENPTSAETIIIAKAKKDVDVSKYEENINNVLTQKTDEMTNYNLPDQVKLIEKTKKKFNDDSFYVVISDKGDIMAETIEKGLDI